jgi:transcriptional regulator with XRE-family HTH domain
VDKFILGSRINELRRETGMTQTKLGQLCGGWSKSRIGNYEKGERTPGTDDLLKIADVFKLTLGNDAYFYIFTGKRIPAFLDESNYKTPFVEFTPADAVKLMEDVLDVAEEVGMCNFENKHKPSEMAALFSKKCNEFINSSSSRKAL